MKARQLVRAVLVLGIGAATVGCETKAGTGALIGGGVGAVAGGLIGSKSHGRAGEGAAIGAVVGAGAGALTGHLMDKADERERAEQAPPPPRVAYREQYADARRLTQSDVVTWANRGMRDEVIIDRIERSGTVFHLTAADENRLRDAGVSEEVIRAMRDTERR